MSYVTNPDAPERSLALVAAERIARVLRDEMGEYVIRIDESVRSRFQVIIEVPFRVEQMTWRERQEAQDG